MKKKICFMVTDAISFNVLCSGQLEYFRDNLDAEIWLLCGGSKQQVAKLEARSIGKVVHLPIARKPSPFSDFYCLVYLVRFFLKNRFDLVVYSTPKALLLGSLASFFTRQKQRVAIVRGRAYENYFGWKRCLFSGLDRVSLGISHHVLFISDSLKRAFESERIIPAARGVVLRSGSSNGVDLDKFNVESSPKTDVLNVVSVGRICVDKGIQELFEVVNLVTAASSRVVFCLVGAVEDEYSKLLLAKMISSGCVKHVEHTENVEDYLRSADIHLFLSHREGFGNVAIEAAACGVPTFSFDVVGVKDSVKNGVSGKRFDRNDVQGIANEIIVASRDAASFRELYPEAREWAACHFSQRLVWDAYKNYYQNIIG